MPQKLKSMKNTLASILIKEGIISSDYIRWMNADKFPKSWSIGSEAISKLIQPESRVVEFGAGSARLRELLPIGCTYLGTDIVKRTPDMVLCDLNASQLPQLGRFDVAVFSGVLEYVRDVPRVVDYLYGFVDAVIASYAVNVSSSNLSRMGRGWVNNYSRDEFIEVFEAGGFEAIQCIPFNGHVIFVFRKRNRVQVM